MCGILLRALSLSIIYFCLLEYSAGVKVVTLGGQMLGAAVLGVWASIFHTVSRKVVTTRVLQIMFSTLWLVVLAYLLVNSLPGWNIVSAVKAGYLLISFCLLSIIADFYIVDK